MKFFHEFGVREKGAKRRKFEIIRQKIQLFYHQLLNVVFCETCWILIKLNRNEDLKIWKEKDVVKFCLSFQFWSTRKYHKKVYWKVFLWIRNLTSSLELEVSLEVL